VDGGEAVRLAGGLLRAAPRVTPVAGHPLAFWADASGMERRGGEAAVAQELLRAAREAGFPAARVAVAGSCIAAAAATRERGTAWRVVPPGRDARFLRHRPLATLPMEADLREALGLLGLRSCGQLAGLAAADVELRWGVPGVQAWRLARGEDPRWPFRPPAPDRVEAEAEWEPPIEGLEPLRFVLRGLIASICEQTGRRQRVPAGLRLVLRLEGAPLRERELRPARPTADARVLAALCEHALEGMAGAEGLDAPVTGLRIEATESGAALADQLDIFRPAAPDPAAVHSALAPLLARWGEGALNRAVPRGGHLPATHAVWVGAALAELTERHRFPAGRVAEGEAAAPAAEAPRSTEPHLALCLRRFPEPVPARVAIGAAGAPTRLAGRATGPRAGAALPPLPNGPALRAEGPEHLSGGWWGNAYAREYWLVEADRALWLLFRDARDDGWWLEGWWD
jgi:protein ImuB